MAQVCRVVSRMALVAALAGCDGGPDWSAPENLMVREESADRDGWAELTYWSMLDVPCAPVFEALQDVERYPDFVPGVNRTQLLASTPDSKTVQIAQQVIGRQSNAKVEWTFDRRRPRISFKTITSDLAYNDGFYDFEASPDGRRCLVRSRFLIRQGGGLSMPALRQGTRESFLAAARGVRQRAGMVAGVAAGTPPEATPPAR